MIKHFLILVFGLIAFLQTHAQFDEDYVQEQPKPVVGGKPQFLLKTNPLAIISGEIPVFTSEYRLLGEYIPDNKQSYNFGVSLFTMGPLLRQALDNDSSLAGSNISSTDFRVLGYRLQAGYRFYPFYLLKKTYLSEIEVPEGFYVYGLVSHSDARFYIRNNRTNQIQFSHTSVTLNLGYQLLIVDDIFFDVYAGAGYKNNQVVEISPGSSNVVTREFADIGFIYGTNLKINLGLHIGYRF